jgi:hypothetical protein
VHILEFVNMPPPRQLPKSPGAVQDIQDFGGSFVYLFVCFSVMGIELRVWCFLGKLSTIELKP